MAPGAIVHEYKTVPCRRCDVYGPESWVIFSDLDGTLLDVGDHSFEVTGPLMERLARLNIPLIVATSKTLAEVRALVLPGPSLPIILENGGLLAVPAGPFARFAGDRVVDGDRLVFYSPSHAQILASLDVLREHGFVFDSFHDLGDIGVAERCGMPVDEARLARQRLCSEPILWRDTEARRLEFERALVDHGLHIVEVDHVLHVLGVGADKGRAMRGLLGLYRLYDWPLAKSMALGDGPNDLPILRAADRPVVVRRADGTWMDAHGLSGAMHTNGIGAQGWCEAVEGLLAEHGMGGGPQARERA